MTEEEFTQHFPNRRVLDEDHPDVEKIDSPQHRPMGETSGYTGEIIEAIDLAEALDLSRRDDVQIKGGVRYRHDEETAVHAIFWKVRRD